MSVERSVSPAEPMNNGLYVAEVYFGWKLLEWRDGQWYHTGLNSPWTASKPVQWVGPLPALLKAETPAEPPQYDL